MNRFSVSALLLMLGSVVTAGANAQQGPRLGLGPALTARPVTLPAYRPRLPVRSYPVYYGGGDYYSAPSVAPVAPPARGPYLAGNGQWIPTGQQADAMALQWEPGDTRATAASASGHWDWKRASLAEIVELSRRNKASRAVD